MNQSSTLVIANPSSGGGSTAKKWDDIKKTISNSISGESKFVLTKQAHEATRIARKALKNGTDLIIAVGGDGTANEVANGFFERKNGSYHNVNPKATMSFIPSGTRNVLAKSYSLPEGMEDNLKLLSSKPKLIDVIMAGARSDSGQKNSRIFLNAAEIGLGAHIIDRSRKIRNVVNSRTVSTLATVISTVPTYRSNECELSINDGEWRLLSHITMCIVANGEFLGGGFKVTSKAKTSDGLLDIVILKDSGSLKLLDELLNMKSGDYVNEDNVIYEQAKKISIRSNEREVRVTVDGEPIGMLPATFEILPRALKFI